MNSKDLLRLAALIHNFNDKSTFISVLRKVVDYVFITKKTDTLMVSDIIKCLKGSSGLLMEFTTQDIVYACKNVSSRYEYVHKQNN